MLLRLKLIWLSSSASRTLPDDLAVFCENVLVSICASSKDVYKENP